MILQVLVMHIIKKSIVLGKGFMNWPKKQNYVIVKWFFICTWVTPSISNLWSHLKWNTILKSCVPFFFSFSTSQQQLCCSCRSEMQRYQQKLIRTLKVVVTLLWFCALEYSIFVVIERPFSNKTRFFVPPKPYKLNKRHLQKLWRKENVLFTASSGLQSP